MAFEPRGHHFWLGYTFFAREVNPQTKCHVGREPGRRPAAAHGARRVIAVCGHSGPRWGKKTRVGLNGVPAAARRPRQAKAGQGRPKPSAVVGRLALAGTRPSETVVLVWLFTRRVAKADQSPPWGGVVARHWQGTTVRDGGTGVALYERGGLPRFGHRHLKDGEGVHGRGNAPSGPCLRNTRRPTEAR